MVFLDENLGVEQQTGLEHTVGGLVHAVHVLYGKVLQAGIQLVNHELPDFLAGGVEVGVGRRGNRGGHLGVQRQ